MLVEHPSFDVMEIVTYDPTLDREAQRIYVNSATVYAHLDRTDIEKQTHSAQLNAILLDEEHFVHKAVFELLTKYLNITEYSTAQRRMRVALSDSSHFIVEKPTELTAFQSPHHHTLLEGEAEEAMRVIEAEKAALKEHSEQAKILEDIVQATLTQTERSRIADVFTHLCNNVPLCEEEAEIWRKMTTTMPSAEETDSLLATVLEPFGLTIPPDFTVPLKPCVGDTDVVSSDFSASGATDTDLVLSKPLSNASTQPLIQTIAPSSNSTPAVSALASCASMPKHTSAVPLLLSPSAPASVSASAFPHQQQQEQQQLVNPPSQLAQPSHPSTAIGARVIVADKGRSAESPHRNTLKKPPGAGAPTSGKKGAKTSSRRRAAPKTSKFPVSGKDSAMEEGTGEARDLDKSALHPAIRRLVDTVGSVASTLRANIRPRRPKAPNSFGSTSSTASSSKSSATSSFSSSTVAGSSAAPSFCSPSASFSTNTSSFAAGQTGKAGMLGMQEDCASRVVAFEEDFPLACGGAHVGCASGFEGDADNISYESGGGGGGGAYASNGHVGIGGRGSDGIDSNTGSLASTKLLRKKVLDTLGFDDDDDDDDDGEGNFGNDLSLSPLPPLLPGKSARILGISGGKGYSSPAKSRYAFADSSSKKKSTTAAAFDDVADNENINNGSENSSFSSLSLSSKISAILFRSNSSMAVAPAPLYTSTTAQANAGGVASGSAGPVSLVGMLIASLGSSSSKKQIFPLE